MKLIPEWMPSGKIQEVGLNGERAHVRGFQRDKNSKHGKK